MNWISVKDRLPDISDFYLIAYYFRRKSIKDICVTEAFFLPPTDEWVWGSIDGEVYYSDDKKNQFIVTHWMPLPKPPQE